MTKPSDLYDILKRRTKIASGIFHVEVEKWPLALPARIINSMAGDGGHLVHMDLNAVLNSGEILL